MEERSRAFFNEASKKLEMAKEELFKPAEDLVGYSVCKNAQFAIENYLKGFLTNNNIELKGIETINSLYIKCVELDANFSIFDINVISCKNNPIDSHYCSEIKKSERML